MKKELRDILDTLDPAEFNELKHSIMLANEARDFMGKYNISLKEFMEGIKLNKKKALQYLSGSYPFDIKTIALMEAYVEDYLKSKVNVELIRVPMDLEEENERKSNKNTK